MGILSANDYVRDSLWFTVNLEHKQGTQFMEPALIEMDCSKFEVDDGHISFRSGKSVAKSRLKVISIGYLLWRPNPGPLRKTTPISITFTMAEDDRQF